MCLEPERRMASLPRGAVLRRQIATLVRVTALVEDENERTAKLPTAQARAIELFAEVQRRALIAPGIRESQASDA
jgi:hypothetical protein